MIKSILTTIVTLLPLFVGAQQKISYAYDANGNRVSRTIVLPKQAAIAMKNHVDSIFFEEKLAENQLKIYPNPVQSELTIAVDRYEPAMQGKFSLYDTNGAMLVTSELLGAITKVDMGHYAQGIYLLRIQLNGESTTWKIIKQ